jgi:alcohol dehydrogenase
MVLNCYPPGVSPVDVGCCISGLKSGGSVVLMGGISETVSFPCNEMMFGDIIVRGQFMYPPSAIRKIIGMIEAGLLNLDGFDEKVFKLGDVLEAVEHSASQGSKRFLFSTVLEPSVHIT